MDASTTGRHLRAIYDLDTLDTRITTPETVAHRTVLDTRDARDAPDPKLTAQEQRARAAAGPSRWRTAEFGLYYVVFAVALPYMFWVPYRVSSPSDPRYHKFEPYLAPGWVPGRKIDNTDAQYHLFRENLPYLLLLLLLHPLLRRLCDRLLCASPVQARASPSRLSPPSQQRVASLAHLAGRISFDAVFALLFLAALHGFSALKIVAILAANHRLATGLPRRYVPVATWVFNISVLFANELGRGYSFATAGRVVAAAFRLPGAAAAAAPDLVPGWSAPSSLERLGDWMDARGGLIVRWEILFNVTVLRLISFNMDYYWSGDRKNAASVEKKQLDMANLSERDRVTVPAPPEAFTFRHYLGYVVYAPLYLTGPIISFNDYISQSRHRSATIESDRTVRYAVRLGLALLAMELMLHFIYVGAIAKAGPVWSSYTAAQLALLSYHNLHIIWLKLLIPWRLSRLWALVDGIDPPENMLRCVSNNYSTLAFWRGWHRSFNRWLVRYLFVPLGGSSFATAGGAARSVLSYVLVFTFVALWHDIKLRLLLWGWLIVLFMLPEMTARALFSPTRWEHRPTTYRVLRGVGGVLSVLMMMIANLVGFAFGADGLRSIVAGILGAWSGVAFVAGSCCAIFVGVQVMFEIREAELRRGVALKC